MLWMELEYIMLSEMSVSERQILYDFSQVRNLRNKTDEHREKKKEGQIRKQTLNYREQTEGSRVGGGQGDG